MKLRNSILIVAMVLPMLLMALPAASAVGTCTAKDPTCPGVVCYGYTNGHWQNCVSKNPCDLFIDGCAPPCGTTTCSPPE